MSNPKEIAASLLRFAVGVDIFLHGAVRFGDYPKFVETTIGMFKDSPLPDFAVSGFVHLIPFAEAVIGFFVLLGFLTLPALVAGMLMMVALMIGMCFLQKWEIVGLQLNYALIYAVCIYTVDLNSWSLDRWLRRTTPRAP